MTRARCARPAWASTGLVLRMACSVLPGIVLLHASAAECAHAQEARGVIRAQSVLVGAAMGGAHALVAIDPRGASPLADEPLLLLGLLTGATFGALVDRAPAGLELSYGWGAVRVGDLRDDLAARGERRTPLGSRVTETRLTLMVNGRSRLALGPLLAFVSHGFEQIEQETRCGSFFGCISGDYVTSHSHLQALNMGAAGHLRLGTAPGPLLVTFGAGIAAVRLESEMGDGSGVAPFLEGGVRLTRERGLLRAVEGGVRAQRAGLAGTRFDLSGFSLRLVLAYGPPR